MASLDPGQSCGRSRWHICVVSYAVQTWSQEQVWVMGMWWPGSRQDGCHRDCMSAPNLGCCCLLCSVQWGSWGEQPLCRVSTASLGKTISLKNPSGNRGRAAAPCTQAYMERVCIGIHTPSMYTGRSCCADVHPWVRALRAKGGAGVTGQEAVPAQVLPHMSTDLRVYKMIPTGNPSAGMPTLWPGPRLPAGG